ncbi:unnamed protein product [Fusarium graminearum]|nr:unnamed protein product [Fusarium graminearum]
MSSVTFLFVFVTILTIVFLLLNFILAPHNPKLYREINKLGKTAKFRGTPKASGTKPYMKINKPEDE